MFTEHLITEIGYWALFQAGEATPVRLDCGLRHALDLAFERQLGILPLTVWHQLAPQCDAVLAGYFGVFLIDPAHCYPLRLFRRKVAATAYAQRIQGHVCRLRDWQYRGYPPPLAED